MKYDVLLVHPPAIYDFRSRIVFPGPLAETVSHYTTMLIAVPVGMLSIAELLERNGYRVKILNLGEKMISDRNYDFNREIMKLEADIYGIDLHWVAHSQGAIEVAKVCKKRHPNSMLVLGGLTASYFHTEIVTRYNFIDAIIRGEGEEPFLKLVSGLEKHIDLSSVPNLTYKDKEGRVHINELEEPCGDLDEYEFTRLGLVEPRELMLTTAKGLRTWTLPLCRGCTLNCVTCGGSAYSYSKLFGRVRPALRSPGKIVEDIHKLEENGVRGIFLIMDPRICGKRSYLDLVNTLKREKPNIEQLGIELFFPASEDFLTKLSSIGIPIILNISPESGDEEVRRFQGRRYSNEALIKTIEAAHKFKFQIAVFFMVGLAKETDGTMAKTWDLCEKIYRIDRHLRSELERAVHGPVWVKPRIGPMMLLDPGSLAFDSPERFGYKLILRSFEDHYEALSRPSWKSWINYETANFTKESLCQIISKSLAKLAVLEQVYGLYEEAERNYTDYNLFRVWVDSFISEEVNNLISLPNREIEERVRALNEAVNLFYTMHPLEVREPMIEPDRLGYRKKIREILHGSRGLSVYKSVAG